MPTRSPAKAATTSAAQAAPAALAFRQYMNSFRRSLEAENKSPRTVKTYMEAIGLFHEFVLQQGMPSALPSIHREHVEAFIAGLLAKGQKPATASNRYRALKVFFKWAVEEGELAHSPMENTKPPHIPEQSPAVLTEEQLRKLLKSVEGKSFEERRDLAVIRLLIDTGMRRSEIAGLKVEDVDLDNNLAYVIGRGRRPRTCPFGRKTSQALDRYLRIRGTHRDAELPNLWLGKAGKMTDSGIFQIAADRARAVGIEGVFLHQFRHTFAHSYLSDGGNEGDLMMLAGWRSREMLQRYGASAASERARNAYKQHSPGDKL